MSTLQSFWLFGKKSHLIKVGLIRRVRNWDLGSPSSVLSLWPWERCLSFQSLFPRLETKGSFAAFLWGVFWRVVIDHFPRSKCPMYRKSAGISENLQLKSFQIHCYFHLGAFSYRETRLVPVDSILYSSTPEKQISKLFIYSSFVWDISAHYPLAGPLNVHSEMRTSWLNK